MGIIWSNFASEELKEIFNYYKIIANEKIANRIITDIFDVTNRLINHPKSGPKEILLEELNEGHRYLVQGNFKILYKLVKEGVLITDIFDTRQNPTKIKRGQ